MAVSPKTVKANESWILTTYVKANFAAAAASVSVINSAACDRLISEDAVKERLCWRGKMQFLVFNLSADFPFKLLQKFSFKELSWRHHA